MHTSFHSKFFIMKICIKVKLPFCHVRYMTPFEAAIFILQSLLAIPMVQCAGSSHSDQLQQCQVPNFASAAELVAV